MPLPMFSCDGSPGVCFARALTGGPLAALGAACVLLMLLAGCRASSSGTPEAAASACTFANPIGPGQDPWVVRHDGWYYLVESRDGGIYVYKSEALTEIKGNGVKVWEAPDSGWNRTHIWAPELHFIDGRWYIYYAAGEDGPPYIHQRSGVLESTGADPQGEYVDRGQLYTGDRIETGEENIWAIDVTVLRHGGRLYAVWSGWEENRSTDKTPQHLYIAAMENPWTIGSNRVKLTSPTEPWERGTELDLVEGPQILERDGRVFIVYSTRESWLPAYRLALLRLRSPDADPMDPGSWTKHGPVFAGTEDVHGTGHASFTTSPDGTEDWIVYHAKKSTEPGWERVIHAQPFTWDDNGMPDFGTPVAAGEPIPVPSGQGACE